MSKKNETTTNVRVGIADSNHVVQVDSALAAEEIKNLVTSALTKHEPLVLVDSKGLTTVIAAEKIAFVEFGAAEERKVGFGAL